jgi:uncharacterized protein (DUF362 family)
VENTRRAIELLGGITRFVTSGKTVAIKPNMAWNKPPEQAANTNPEVIATLVRLCKEAGAAKVLVFDRPCDKAESTYKTSGIAEAAEKAGAKVDYVLPYSFQRVVFPNGRILREWELYADALSADVFINVPVAKDHDQARLTLAMKNLMGIQGGQRQSMHKELPQKLADLSSGFRTVLTVMDATRILTRNGPNGISLDDAVDTDTVIAGTNIVSVDTITCETFKKEFRLRRSLVDYVHKAAEMGLGTSDINAIMVKEA